MLYWSHGEFDYPDVIPKRANFVESMTVSSFEKAKELIMSEFAKNSDTNRNLDDDEKQLHLIEGHVFYGCKHYLRGCKVECDECKKFFPCRVCHDKDADHPMERRDTKNVWCYFCEKVGPIGKNCVHCQKSFADFYCKSCKFLISTPFHHTYHCPKCDLCRRGPEKSLYHCDVCEVCLFASEKETHICKREGTKTNCPVCRYDMFTSRKPIWSAPCGHFFHRKCAYSLFRSHNYNCPLCRTLLCSFDIKLPEVQQL